MILITTAINPKFKTQKGNVSVTFPDEAQVVCKVFCGSCGRKHGENIILMEHRLVTL